MITAKSMEQVRDAFGGRVPWFGVMEEDGYDGSVTLYDKDEEEQDAVTALHFCEGGYEVCVEDDGVPTTCEFFEDFAEAWAAYKRQAGEHTSGL